MTRGWASYGALHRQTPGLHAHNLFSVGFRLVFLRYALGARVVATWLLAAAAGQQWQRQPCTGRR
eukprot:COSAG01_NODE_3990_length_5458_cov_2.452323_11_plen_65_part_00